MSSPDDRPRDPADEPAYREPTPPHDTESRLDHVDPDDHLSPDDVRDDAEETGSD